MRRPLALLLTCAALLAGFAATTPATAAEPVHETRCDARSTMLGFLATRYNEQPVAMGVAEGGDLIEVLTSKTGSTFTIIVTDPQGETCMVAAGQGWEVFAQKVARLPI